jgi:DNA-binding phage protein
MAKHTKSQNDLIDHLNNVLIVGDSIAFQKLLLHYACGRHGVALVAEQAGVRRETIWRYGKGEVAAPLETLVKIIAAVGAKIIVVADEAP